MRKKPLENIGKGEVALLFCMLDRLEFFGNSTQFRLQTTLGKKPWGKNVGEAENANNLHFSPFPQCFLPFQKQLKSFHWHISCPLQNALNLIQSKSLLFGKDQLMKHTYFCGVMSPSTATIGKYLYWSFKRVSPERIRTWNQISFKVLCPKMT